MLRREILDESRGRENGAAPRFDCSSGREEGPVSSVAALARCPHGAAPKWEVPAQGRDLNRTALVPQHAGIIPQTANARTHNGGVWFPGIFKKFGHPCGGTAIRNLRKARQLLLRPQNEGEVGLPGRQLRLPCLPMDERGNLERAHRARRALRESAGERRASVLARVEDS
jgi:hypothetical protein